MIDRLKPNIAIVSITSREMLVFKFSVFKKLSPEDQIKRLSDHITHICRALEAMEATRKISYQSWLVILPEYVITKSDGGYYYNIISSDIKKIFKEEMKSLSSIFPKLTIIAGSVATTKTLSHDTKLLYERLEAIEAYYECATKIIGLNNLSALQRGFIGGLRALMEDIPHEISIVRNTVYKFSGGDNEFSEESYVKSFPASTELLGTECMDTSVYQPGSKKSSPYFHLSSVDEACIPIGIEVCLEHNEGVLRHRAMQDAIPMMPLHVIVSNTTPINLKNLYGEQVLQVDPDENLSLIRTIPDSQLSLKIDSFTTNFLQAGSLTLIPVPTCNAIHILCKSSEEDKEAMLVELLHAGLDINERGDEDQFTPLHIAVTRSDIPTLRLLLKHGADPAITDADGKTPVELARDYCNKPTLDALINIIELIEQEKNSFNPGSPRSF